MRHTLAGLLLLAATVPAMGQSRPSVNQSGYTQQGVSVVTRKDVSDAVQPRVDSVGGTLTNGKLTSPTITGGTTADMAFLRGTLTNSALVNPYLTGGSAPGTDVTTARVSVGGLASQTLTDILSGAAPSTGQNIRGGQTLQTCPVANCPTSPGSGFGGNGGGPTLSSQWVYGSTVADRTVSEFLSNIGLYVGTGAGNGQKVAQYVGAMQGPGAGTAWALNTDIVRGACPGGSNSLYGMPGSGIPFGQSGCGAAPGSIGSQNGTIGYELDLTNWDADTATSGAFVVGMYIQTTSTYTSGAGISFGKGSGAVSWHHGIELAPGTVADASVYDVSNAPFSLLTSGTHSQATIADQSTGPVGLLLTGLKSTADIQVQTNSPAALSLGGTHSLSTLYDNSAGPSAFKVDGYHTVASVDLHGNGPAAITMSGTYSLAALSTMAANAPIALQVASGQQVCWSGNNACISYSTQTHRYYFSDGAGNIVASLGDGGNLILKGSLTQNGTP